MKAFYALAISFTLLLPKVSYGIVGSIVRQPLVAELKALELNLQIYQIFFAIIGAALAFLLTQGLEIRKVFFKRRNCCEKIPLVLCPLSLTLASMILFWDYFTILNMLRNGGGITFDDLRGTYALIPFVIGIVTFVLSVLTVWKVKE